MSFPQFIRYDAVRQYIAAIRYKGTRELNTYLDDESIDLSQCSTTLLCWAFYFLNKNNPTQDELRNLITRDIDRREHPVGIDVLNPNHESEDFSSKRDLCDSALDIIAESWKPLYDLIGIVHPRICYPSSDILAERNFESASDPKYFGHLYFAMTRKTPMGWAEIIAHEMGHHYLFVIHAAFHRKVDAPWKEKFHSSIRNTDRPLIGIFHGTVAETFMILLAKSVLNNNELADHHPEAEELLTRQLQHFAKDYATVEAHRAYDIDTDLKAAVEYCLTMGE